MTSWLILPKPINIIIVVGRKLGSRNTHMGMGQTVVGRKLGSSKCICDRATVTEFSVLPEEIKRTTDTSHSTEEGRAPVTTLGYARSDTW